MNKKMMLSANASKALFLAAMGCSLLMPAQLMASQLVGDAPAMAVEAQAVNAQGGRSEERR